MNGHRCRLLDSTLHAHTMMYFECTSDSGSTAAVGPRVMRYAEMPPPSQKVRSETLAPMPLKKRSPTVSPLRMPMLPR